MVDHCPFVLDRTLPPSHHVPDTHVWILCFKSRPSLDKCEYMKLPIKLVLPEVVKLYDLKPKAKNGYVYTERRIDIPDLPQAGMLEKELSKERLKQNSYIL